MWATSVGQLSGYFSDLVIAIVMFEETLILLNNPIDKYCVICISFIGMTCG